MFNKHLWHPKQHCWYECGEHKLNHSLARALRSMDRHTDNAENDNTPPAKFVHGIKTLNENIVFLKRKKRKNVQFKAK